MQELRDLPENLLYAVLASSQVPLLLQLHVLPEDLHQAALLAAFPSITATSSITVPFTWDTACYHSIFWDLLAQERHLKRFSCSLSKFPQRSDALVECVAKFQGLVSLHLANLMLGNDLAVHLLSSLTCQGSLEHLDLSGNCLKFMFDDEEQAAKDFTQALANLKALRSLNLSGNPLKDKFFVHLACYRSQFTGLQSLNVSSCIIHQLGVNALSRVVSSCTALRDFRATNMRGSVDLIQSLTNCPKLQHLQLPEIVWSSKDHISIPANAALHAGNRTGFPVAARIIATLTGLQALQLPYKKLTARDFQAIADHMTSLTALRTLTAYTTGVTDAGTAALKAFVSHLPSFEEVHIMDDNSGTTEKWIHEACMRAKSYKTPASLLGVHLSDLMLHYDGRSASAYRVLQCPMALKTLSVGDIVYGEGAALALAAQIGRIQSLQSLQHLHLNSLSLGDKAMQTLAGSIGRMRSLETLDLGKNPFTLPGMVAVASQLANLKCLRALHLSKCFIGVSEAKALVEHFSCLSDLRTLELRYSLHDEAAIVLAPALDELRALESLDLSHNNLTCRALEHLIVYVTRLQALQLLNLRFNCIEERGFRVLERCVRALPSLRALLIEQSEDSVNSIPEISPYMCLLACL